MTVHWFDDLYNVRAYYVRVRAVCGVWCWPLLLCVDYRSSRRVTIRSYSTRRSVVAAAAILLLTIWAIWAIWVRVSAWTTCCSALQWVWVGTLPIVLLPAMVTLARMMMMMVVLALALAVAVALVVGCKLLRLPPMIRYHNDNALPPYTYLDLTLLKVAG
jgi:hypothetical protein